MKKNGLTEISYTVFLIPSIVFLSDMILTS